MPPDQNASQTRSTLLFKSPVINCLPLDVWPGRLAGLEPNFIQRRGDNGQVRRGAAVLSKAVECRPAAGGTRSSRAEQWAVSDILPSFDL